MFDQNWLKRHMLSTQPKPVGENDIGPGKGDPGAGLAGLGPLTPTTPQARLNPSNAKPVLEGTTATLPPQSAGEGAIPPLPTPLGRFGGLSGPASGPAAGGLSQLTPKFPDAAPPVAPARPSAGAFSQTTQPSGQILPGGGLGSPSPWQMPMSNPMQGGMPGFMPGSFGYSAFDNGVNMNSWNFGNEGGGGVKYFVVMCKDDVEVRASPTYADDTRIGHFLHPGQIVAIDERRMVTGSWFLHLADGRGWVFETKDRLLVMTEAHGFERGLWHYSIVCDDDVETRIAPTYSDDARTGVVLGSGDCIAVDERCTIGGARFLKAADGRGWVFETKDRLLVFSEVRAKAQEARDFARGLWHYTVVCDDDVEIRAAPTYSDEARTGLVLHPGDCTSVDERCRVGATWFLRLADGRGWIFETKDSRRVMMQLH